MNDEGKETQPQLELAWLARYFYARGFKDKAREIMDRLHPNNNLVDIDSANVYNMQDNDEERRA